MPAGIEITSLLPYVYETVHCALSRGSVATFVCVSADASAERWGAGVVICLERGADLHTAQLMPLPLTVSCFSKIQIVLPFWYRLTRVVPGKWPLNGYVCLFS